MEVTCRRSDVDHFTKAEHDLFVGDGIGDTEHAANVFADEVNYAYDVSDGDPGRLSVIPSGIPYYGYHGEGGDYGAGEFACDGKTFRYVVADMRQKAYPVRFEPFKGGAGFHPVISDLESIVEFLSFKERVKAMVNQPVSAPNALTTVESGAA